MKKRIVAMGLMATMSLGLATSASAVSTTGQIGKLTLTSTKMTATTTITNGAQPAQGMQGYVKATATAKNKQTITKHDYTNGRASVTVTASYTETGKSKFKSAKSVHQQTYYGTLLINESLNLSL